ncbi:MAG: endonuclease III [Coriobacteriales bacterium]|nr:endonuclease III [Coriobacteriales bacterium]
MSRESLAAKRRRAVAVLDRLAPLYPGGEQALLEHRDPFTLLIAVLLSAQTTDAAVNRVSPELFKRWPDARALASASLGEVSEVILSLGFYNTKAKNSILCAQKLLADFGGVVPQTMEELTSLPGVGRKTANIVLNSAFGHAVGIAVDTHVFRIATRLRLTAASEPLHAERDLLRVVPQSYWSMINRCWVLFGREYCCARRPHCARCPTNDLCPSAGKAVQ